MRRIGIDVGGTHTDAVLLEGDALIASTKALTSSDVVGGITEALDTIIGSANADTGKIDAVMIGTTQFTNAVVERRELAPVAAIRIGLPSGKGIPHLIDWPEDVAAAVQGKSYMLPGGFLYDGSPLAEMDDVALDKVVADIAASSIRNIAIASAFSPMNHGPEQVVADRVGAAIPDARISCSHAIGGLGLLERENAAILNAALLPFADRVVASFEKALEERGLNCPLFISQNDGTLMDAAFIRRFPALTFASGPTNSLRGAWKLTGLTDAIVVDIGGTTSDIGVLQGGFPRESNNVIDVGGVRTNFRMPDILAIGLGGGSLVSEDGGQIGPQSVGHNLVREGLVFGGDTLTTTDIVVAAGNAQIGDPSRVLSVAHETVENAERKMHEMLDRAIDRMRPGGRKMPVILVGGGSILVSKDLEAATEIHRPENAGVANAIGAAIAQIGGEAEQMLSYRSIDRKDALATVTRQASETAVWAGADAASLKVTDIEETPIPYMDEGATRVRVKVVGELAAIRSPDGATA